MYTYHTEISLDIKTAWQEKDLPRIISANVLAFYVEDEEAFNCVIFISSLKLHSSKFLYGYNCSTRMNSGASEFEIFFG